jgi:hypothetical protein
MLQSISFTVLYTLNISLCKIRNSEAFAHYVKEETIFLTVAKNAISTYHKLKVGNPLLRQLCDEHYWSK